MITKHKADGRTRLSRLWVPTGGITAGSAEDSHSKLVRAGFLRQAHPGVFHLLPLGRRVYDKLEALIDRFMSTLRASKLDLSSISSAELWARSGRLRSAGSELFRFKDRKEVDYLLSPTHEEEITSLVSNTVNSYKDLPVRLYQISRKFRDELRPRHGLLRSREFVMKDLYTFDYDATLALATYHEVRSVYARLFDELKLPYLVAEANSGEMGGNLSHEFHFPSSKGEDHVIRCTTCEYVANEELAQSKPPSGNQPSDGCEEGTFDGPGCDDISTKIRVWRGISLDRLTLVNIWYPSATSLMPVARTASSARPDPVINIYAAKAAMPSIDASIEDPLPFWSDQIRKLSTGDAQPSVIKSLRLVNLLDCRLSDAFRISIESRDSRFPFWPSRLIGTNPDIEMSFLSMDALTGQPLNFLRIEEGDACPRCSDGTLTVQRAIELGHTFFLGTRYSDPLGATVALPSELLPEDETGVKDALGGGGSRLTGRVAMQMGCHGIGVSRMIGAVAESLADEKGLNWPRVMAPFEVVVIPGNGLDAAAMEVYDMLSPMPGTPDGSRLDLILDDRGETFPWKMRDADLVGYPIIVVVGRRWNTERMCEVQCRRLGVRRDLPIHTLPAFIKSLLVNL